MTEDTYQIQVQGWISKRWASWFDGMTIAYEEINGSPVTTLTGAVADQAALRGILNRIWDLNLMLISVYPVEKR